MIGFERGALGAVIAAAASALLADAVPAQELARRLRAAPDGEVRVTFAARSGVCGDGRDVVGAGRSLFIWPSIESYGRWSGVTCVPGDVRVTLTVREREVTRVRARIGGAWEGAREEVTDLGTVGAPEAARLLLTLAERLDTRAGKEAILPAALADSVTIVPTLLRIARDDARPRETRKAAVRWVGELGDESVVPELESIARGEGDKGLRESAVMALSHLPDEAGLGALTTIARSDADLFLRKKTLFWLGQMEDPRARRTIRAMIEQGDAEYEVKKAAVFALGQGHAATREDFTFLRATYGRAESEPLRQQIIQTVAQWKDADGIRWLLERARDRSESVSARKHALFWAGQSRATTSELSALYEALDERPVKEHAIFVLSQRHDEAAVDKLMDIARRDPDHAMRKKALFWLSQKDDPRIAKMLAELIAR